MKEILAVHTHQTLNALKLNNIPADNFSPHKETIHANI